VKRVLLIDDHAILRRGLKLILNDYFKNITILEASDSIRAEVLIEKENLDLIILDINIPGRGGLDLLADIKRKNSTTPVLLLSMYPECQFAVRGFRAGASGYLCKESAPEELISAINTIMNGQHYISPSGLKVITEGLKENSDKPSHHKLSNREYQVFCMIAKGKTVSQIADELSLSIKTISTTKAHILDKMNFNNNSELICYALINKLIQ
jgi:two-component system, NarL family, invasion response regulator UvrY